MEIEDIYKVHREYIEHEDELIHHRTSALVTIQSFLLATFGFTYQKKYEVAGMLFIHDHKLSLSDLGSITTQYNGFLLVLALVGAATSFIALCSILAATNAIKGIERNWQQVSNGQPLPHLPGLTGGGSSVSSATGVALCILAPISFWILWMATLFYLILVVGLR